MDSLPNEIAGVLKKTLGDNFGKTVMIAIVGISAIMGFVVVYNNNRMTKADIALRKAELRKIELEIAAMKAGKA